MHTESPSSSSMISLTRLIVDQECDRRVSTTKIYNLKRYTNELFIFKHKKEIFLKKVLRGTV